MFDLAWHDAGVIAGIRLNRPPANAIGLTEIRELDALLDDCRANHPAAAWCSMPRAGSFPPAPISL